MSTPKYTDYLTPERLAEHTRIREEIKDELPEIWQHADERRDQLMRDGATPRQAISLLLLERSRQGLSDEEMMARSGLDAAALTTMLGRDANPTIATLKAYAQALGKTLLITLADAKDGQG